jgi:acyl-CoA thioesterase
MTPRERVDALRATDRVAEDAGIRVLDAEEGAVRIEMLTHARMGNGHGIVHGGWLFLLADTAAAYAMATDTDDAVTIAGDVVFHAPGRVGTILTALARREHRARSTALVDVVVTDAEGMRLASARLTGRGR